MNRRLILSYLTITVIVLLILEIPLAIFYSQREEERFTAAAERDAVVLAAVYEDVLDLGETLDATAANSYAKRTDSRVVLTDEEGISLIDTEAASSRDFSTRSEVSSALDGIRSAGIRHSETLGADLLYVAVPVASGGEVHGSLRVTLDPHEVTERIQSFWIRLIAVGAVVLLAVAAVSRTIARSVTRPVYQLRATAHRFSSGDLTTRPPPDDAPSEIQELAESMNTMAQRLDLLIATQKEFVGDASHQLRTPLTALRLQLENIESGLSSESERAQIQSAIGEAERLSDIVSDLLKLARAEDGRDPVRIDVAEIVRNHVDVWTAVAETQEATITHDCDGRSVEALAVPGAIQQILDNLIDNALAVSPKGATVEVSLRAGNGAVVISVADQGPGIDDETKPKALERFWRGDSTKPGTGLGLAVVTQLAKASGGSVTLGDSESGGLDVLVRLRASA